MTIQWVPLKPCPVCGLHPQITSQSRGRFFARHRCLKLGMVFTTEDGKQTTGIGDDWNRFVSLLAKGVLADTSTLKPVKTGYSMAPVGLPPRLQALKSLQKRSAGDSGVTNEHPGKDNHPPEPRRKPESGKRLTKLEDIMAAASVGAKNRRNGK